MKEIHEKLSLSYPSLSRDVFLRRFELSLARSTNIKNIYINMSLIKYIVLKLHGTQYREYCVGNSMVSTFSSLKICQINYNRNALFIIRGC